MAFADARDDELLQLADLTGVLEHLLARLHSADLRDDRERPPLDLARIHIADAELLRNDGRRERHGEMRYDVDAPIALDGVGERFDELSDTGRDGRFQQRGAVCGESLFHEAPHSSMRRRILHDGVEEKATAFALENLLELIVEALCILGLVPGLARIGCRVAQNGDDVLVAGNQIHPELLVEMHRILRADRAIELHRFGLNGRVGESGLEQTPVAALEWACARSRVFGLHGRRMQRLPAAYSRSPDLPNGSTGNIRRPTPRWL